MSCFAMEFESLKKRVGGNREKQSFEWTFGATGEELAHITPPDRSTVRILSELNFAIGLNARRNNCYAGQIRKAILVLTASLDEEGVITRTAAARAEQELLPLAGAAQEYEVVFASHAHIDMNWMWGWQETVAVTIATFRTVLDLMREYPEYTFSQSQASVYAIIEEYAPEMADEIRQRIREGRWEVTASAWVETDKNMPDTESLIRHIEYTRNYLSKVWGVPREVLDLDFSPDTFGHSRFIPELDTFGGVKYYYHCRGVQEDVTLYRYRCPSGAELLMYKEPYWYNSGVNPDCGTGILALSDKCAGLKTGLVVYGVGDHGGGPSRRDIERIIEMQGWPVFPKMRFGTVRGFFEKAESVRDRLPVIEHELNYFATGCYTTQSRIKRGNRKTELALLEGEKLSALRAMTEGTASPAERLELAWRKVLFTHFHDILTGSCVQESREYAIGQYAEAIAHAQQAESSSARAITEALDTSRFGIPEEDTRYTQSEGAGAGFGIGSWSGVPNPERGKGKERIYTIFNTSASAKDGCTELTVWDPTFDLRRLEAVDESGSTLEVQLLDREVVKYWDHRYIRILVHVSVPAFGYKTVCIREKKITDYPTFFLSEERTETERGDITLENEFLTVKIDGRDGRICSVRDRSDGSEMLRAPAGLSLVRTEQDTSSAWNIGRYLGIDPLTDAVSVKPEAGSLRSGVTITYKVLSSTAKVTLSLEKGSRALQADLEIDWHESANRSATVPVLIWRMPLAKESDQVLCDVPAGVVSRPAHAQDVPALTFAAALNGDRVPFLVTDCKYGYRLDRNDLIATLINTASNPDPYPERGIHVIRLFAGFGDPAPKAMKELAAALLVPMIPMPTGSHTGRLPGTGTLIGMETGSAVLTSLRERGGEFILRFCELSGSDSRIGITMPFRIREAAVTDLEGNRIAAAEMNGNTVTVMIGAHRLVQLCLKQENS